MADTNIPNTASNPELNRIFIQAVFLLFSRNFPKKNSLFFFSCLTIFTATRPACMPSSELFDEELGRNMEENENPVRKNTEISGNFWGYFSKMQNDQL